MFIMYTADLPRVLKDVSDSIDVICYADDLVLFSRKRCDIQKALAVLADYCDDNKLDLNVSKTKVMKFRRGGRISKQDVFLYKSKPLEIVNYMEYLGVGLQPTWTFTKHLRKMNLKLIGRVNMVRDLQKLSIACAERYFNIMLKPVITYGLKVMWDDLGPLHFRLLDSCKINFFKRVMGLHRSSRNRLIVLYSQTSLLCEDLVREGFRRSSLFDDHIEEWQDKLDSIEESCVLSPAFSTKNWMVAGFEKRHIVCRVSVHGFHHKLCAKGSVEHEKDNDCICQFCGGICSDLNHAINCREIPSISWLNSR